MVLLKIQKRDANSINNAVDFNPSVFRYFADSSEIKLQSVKDGLKSAFLGMLDTVVIPDERLFNELGDWTFLNPVQATTQVGGLIYTTNSYNGIKYIFKEENTVVTQSVAASLGTFVVDGDSKLYRQVNGVFVLEPNLNLATHAGEVAVFQPLSFWQGSPASLELEYPARAAVRGAGYENTVLYRQDLNSPDYDWIVDNTYGTHAKSDDGINYTSFYNNDGFAGCSPGWIGGGDLIQIDAQMGSYTGLTYKLVNGTYVLEPSLMTATHGLSINENINPLAFYGGNPFSPTITTTTPSGFYPVTGLETGTHGKDGNALLPLSYWNSDITPPFPNSIEKTGRLTDNRTGFSMDSKQINLALTATGEALQRYNPIDLITFVELIKLQYSYRDSATKEYGN